MTFSCEVRSTVHLRDRPDVDAGVGHVDRHQAQPVVSLGGRVGPHQGEHPRGEARVGRPHLLAVDQDPFGAHLPPGAQGCEVAAGARLAEALAPEIVGGQDAREPPLLLGGRAPLDQDRPAEAQPDPVQALGRAGRDVLAVEDGRADGVEAQSAMLRGPVDRGEAGLVELALPCPPRREPGRRRRRRRLALRQVVGEPRADPVLQLALLWGQPQVHGASPVAT